MTNPRSENDELLLRLNVARIVLAEEEEEEEEEAHTIVSLLNVTMQKRAEEEIRRRVADLESLSQVSDSLTSAIDLQPLLENILASARKAIPAAEKGTILLTEPDGALRLHAMSGYTDPRLIGLVLPDQKGYAARVARQRIPLKIDDAHAGYEAPYNGTIEEIDAVQSGIAAPLIVKGKVIGVISLDNASRKASFTESDLRLLVNFASSAAGAIENARLFVNLQQSNLELTLAYDATIEGWSAALDLRDKETEGHSQRVTEMSIQLARTLGIGEAELVHVRRGALLHDMGKMGIPDSILLKPDALTDEEWVIMRQHPQHAFDLLSPVAYLKPALDIPYGHHEKWDGSGYPRGLKGEQIPLVARIFAVVDVYDALTSDRPYRLAWTREKALEHIHEQSGKHFEPRVVKAFMDLMAGEKDGP